MPLRYTDIKITVLNEKEQSVEYSDKNELGVDVQKSQKCAMQLDPFARLTVERLHAWVNFGLRLVQERPSQSTVLDPVDLQVIGLNLFRILFGNTDVEQIFRRVHHNFEQKYVDQLAKGDTSLRMRMLLVFHAEADLLSQLPWEFLFIPGDDGSLKNGFFFAGKRTELILTRFVPPQSAILKLPPPTQERLRILVAIYTPTGLGGIREEDLNAVLVKMKAIKNAMVEEVRNCGYDDLKKKIAEFCPHIFHFIGHGAEGKLSLAKAKTDQDYDESRDEKEVQVRWISGDEFRDLFSIDPKPRPRLVFLHACKGAAPTSESTFTSCARLLIDDIPAVVAMQHSISNKDAETFATEFYEKLGAGFEIDEAVRSGRFKLGEMFPPWKHPRFATPVVYLQKNDPLVFPVKEDETPSGQESAAMALPGARPPGAGLSSPLSASAPATSAPVRDNGTTLSERP